MGVGYGAATLELSLIQRGLKSLFTASVFSLLVSALYFRLTPLTDAGSELLARTTPTTWDVLIALFGGAAGAVALTRKGHSNAVPGVAIATALMPPLYIAGYGLATAHWSFLFGALYLFSINCVFIALATFLVCRVLPLPRHTFVSRQRARRVQFGIWAVALLTAAPSVYLAVGIVRDGTFAHNAQRFVEEQLNLPGTFVVTSRILPRPRTLNVLLAGQRLTDAQLQKARTQLPRYRLAGAVLTVRQGLARLDSADTQALRSSVLEDVRSRQEQTLLGYETRMAQLQQVLAHPDSVTAGLPGAAALLREVQVEHPAVRQLGLSRLVRPATDSLRADTTVLVAVRTRRPLPAAEQQRLAAWLRLRAGGRQTLRLLVESQSGATPVRVRARQPRASRR